MKRPSLYTWIAAAALGLAGTACSESSGPTAAGAPELDAAAPSSAIAARRSDGAVWEAVLTPLNAHVTDRAATGKAVFVLDDGTFSARLDIRGVAPGVVHPQHIHGHSDGSTATCPTPRVDADGDHIVSIGEGLPAYGPVIVSLDGELENAAMQATLFPVPADRGYTYAETATEAEIRAYPNIPDTGDLDLETRAVVVHGAFVDGVYVASLPIACGQLRRVR